MPERPRDAVSAASLSYSAAVPGCAPAIALSERRWRAAELVLRTSLWPRDAGQRVVRAPRLPLEEGALLDGHSLVIDVALDVSGALQQHAATAHGAEQMAANDALLGNDPAGDAGAFPDDD